MLYGLWSFVGVIFGFYTFGVYIGKGCVCVLLLTATWCYIPRAVLDLILSVWTLVYT